MPGPLRLRLAGKVVLVVTGVSLLALFMAGVAYRLASGPAFQELVTVEAQSHFRSDVVEYYHENGVLDVGINPGLARRLGEPPPAPGSLLPKSPKAARRSRCQSPDLTSSVSWPPRSTR